MAAVKKVRGSITVEAVFVFPIVFFIILAIIFFTMYLHDRTIIGCVMNEACERFGQTVKQPTDYESGVIYYDKMTEKSLLAKYTESYSKEISSMEDAIRNTLKKRMMLSEVMDVQAKKGINDITLTVKTKNTIPFLHALVYLAGIQTCTYEVKGGIYNPSEYARAAGVSLDVLSQTAAYDKVQEIVDKIENAVK